jgi:hypothetical protein
MLDQVLELSNAYKEGKRTIKKKTEEYEIASASCDHLQEVCMQLKNEKAELEVELDECKVELGTVKSKLHLNEFSEDEVSDLTGSLVDLSLNPEDPIDFAAAKERAKNLSKPDLLQAFNLLIEDVQDLHREFVKTKTAPPTVPPTHPDPEISQMIDEYEGQICDLVCEIHELKKGRQDSPVNMLSESVVSSIKMDLENLKNEFKSMDKRNEQLMKMLETKDKELENSKKHVDRLLTARGNLDHVLSLQGNSRGTGLGYTARKARSKWSPRDTTWIQEYKKGKYVTAKDMHVCNFCGKGGHKIHECIHRKKSKDRNSKHVKLVWVRKDQKQPTVDESGPNLGWVPKPNV